MNRLSNEMIIKYLYYLTNQESGTEEFENLYSTWKNIKDSMDVKEYAKILENVVRFDKQYKVKK